MSILKHKEVIKAWLDGEVIQKLFNGDWIEVVCADERECMRDGLFCESKEYRIKPKTITINGVECPAPMREMPGIGSVCYAVELKVDGGVFVLRFGGLSSEIRLLSTGLLFNTEQGAKAAYEAMIKPLKEFMGGCDE